MGTEPVLETLYSNEMTRLMAREDYIESCRSESFKTYIRPLLPSTWYKEPNFALSITTTTATFHRILRSWLDKPAVNVKVSTYLFKNRNGEGGKKPMCSSKHFQLSAIDGDECLASRLGCCTLGKETSVFHLLVGGGGGPRSGLYPFGKKYIEPGYVALPVRGSDDDAVL